VEDEDGNVIIVPRASTGGGKGMILGASNIVMSDAPLTAKKKFKGPTVVIGNDHKVVEDEGGGDHEWTMFIRGPDGKHNERDTRGIETVIFRLHHDYKPHTVTIATPPFQITRHGKSVFEVGVSIYMAGKGMKDQIVNLVRSLDFVDAGSKERLNMGDHDHPLMGTLASRNPQAKPKPKPKPKVAPKVEEKVKPKDIVLLGNEHQNIKDKGDGEHRWTVYIRGPDGRRGNSRDDFNIEKVRFQLYPTYEPSLIELTRPPFEVTRDGWGTFDVAAEVFLKDGTTLNLVRPLDFIDKGSWKKISMREEARKQKEAAEKASEKAEQDRLNPSKAKGTPKATPKPKSKGASKSKSKSATPRKMDFVIPPGAPKTLKIECNGMVATLLVGDEELQVKTAGKKGELMKPTVFEKHAGSGRKNWKKSIKVVGTEHTIETYFAELAAGNTDIPVEEPVVADEPVMETPKGKSQKRSESAKKDKNVHAAEKMTPGNKETASSKKSAKKKGKPPATPASDKKGSSTKKGSAKKSAKKETPANTKSAKKEKRKFDSSPSTEKPPSGKKAKHDSSPQADGAGAASAATESGAEAPDTSGKRKRIPKVR